MRKVRWTALAALLVLGMASTVQSMPASGVYTEFYSDDTFSEVVGYVYRGCSGSSSDGVRTMYRMTETWSCNSWNEFYDCHYLICHETPGYGEECVVSGYCY